jgi:hypothetical protein
VDAGSLPAAGYTRSGCRRRSRGCRKGQGSKRRSLRLAGMSGRRAFAWSEGAFRRRRSMAVCHIMGVERAGGELWRGA